MLQLSATHLIATLASIALPLAAQSPANQPLALGPVGGSAASIAVDPQDPDVLLAIKYSIGLFRSTDGGASFVPHGTGISAYIEQLTLDPRDDQTLFAIDGNQVFRSTNFGANWIPLELEANNSLKRIAVPTSGTDLLALDAFNVYHSGDDGATWSVAASAAPGGAEFFDAVSFAPSNPSIAYFSSNSGVYRSTDRGQSFSQPGSFSEWIQHVTVSPNDPNTVLAGAWNAFYRSTDGGTTFTQVTNGLPATVNAEFFTWEPDDSLVWFGTLRGVYFSADAGVTWNDANNGFPAVRPIPSAIAFDGQGKRYLGTESNFLSGYVGGGIHMRTSTTAPWRHIAYSEIHVSDIQVAGPGGTRIAVTRSGPYAGAPGQPLAGTPWISIVEDLVVDPTDPDRWITGGVGSFVDNAQIVVHTNGGTQVDITYEQYGAGVVQDVVVDPNDPSRMLAGIFPASFGNEAIIVSSNGGASWSDVPGTASWATRAVAFDPHEPGHALQLSDGNLWASSSNWGQSWSSLRPAWPASGPAVLLAFDPFAQGVLYRGDTGSGLWRSDDGGDTWTALGVSLHIDSDIELHPQIPGLLWVADAGGKVLVSGDRGDTFIDAYAVPQGANASGLALDLADGSLAVGTTGASAWELPAASPLVKLGDGSAGTGGFVPRHYSTGGLPQLGNTAWGFAADRILGGAPVFLLFGTNEVNEPLFGGTLFVGTPRRSISAGTASGAAGVGGAGSMVVSMSIPVMPSLAGATAVSQYVVLDSGAGVVFSNGLRTTLLP